MTPTASPREDEVPTVHPEPEAGNARRLFSWLDRILRPKTTAAVQDYVASVDKLVEEVRSGAARETDSTARFAMQTADYTRQIAEARRLILVPDDGGDPASIPPEGATAPE